MTFTFTLDAFPGYLKFDKSHKVLAALQIIEDVEDETDIYRKNECVEEAKTKYPASGGTPSQG